MTDNNLANDVVQRVVGHAQDIAKQIADTIGSPVDAQNVTRAEQVRLWNLQNPQANLLQVQQMLAQGQHAQAVDVMYPWRNKLIGSGDPQTRVDRAARLAKMAAEGST